MMKKKDGYWMFKAPKKLRDELNRIRIERLKLGKDKEPQTYKRLALAIARHEKLLNDLIRADLKEEEFK